MKRIFKKMAAAVLALTMILSLSVGALATQPGEVNAGTTPSGSVRSTATNEGVAADVVKVLMPTLTTGAFNMYLDPNNLIAQSQETDGGGRFNDDAVVSSGTYVYFDSKSYDDDDASFTNKSQRMDVFNKSNRDLLVEVSVEADKNNNNISFVDSLDDLKDSDGEWLAKPSMYLGISATPKDATEASATDVVTEADYGELVINSNGAIGSCGMLIDPVFAWNADAAVATEAVKKAFSEKWTETVFKVQVNSSAQGKSLNVVTSSGLNNAFRVDNATTSSGARLQQTLVYSDGSKEYQAATLTYYFDQNKIDTIVNSGYSSTEATNSFIVSPWSGNSKAEVSDTINTTEGAYSVKYNNGSYTYEPSDDLEPESLHHTTFQLEAGINPVTAWDGLAVSNPINVDVIWKITAVVDETAPVLDVLSYPAKAGTNATFEMISTGKSMHGDLKAIYGVSYTDAGKVTTFVLGDDDGTLTYDAANDQYTLNCVTKIYSLGTVDVNYVYADGTTGSTPLVIKEGT